jgi:hypothetical protein
MKHFVWVLESHIGPYLRRKNGVSSNYVLPQDHTAIDVRDLAGASIWMILRGKNGDVIFAMINVSSIERFEDGHNVGDYLLSTDLTKSFRCIHDYLSAGKAFFQEYTSGYDLGLRQIEKSLQNQLCDHVSRQLTVKFQEPQEYLLKKSPAFLQRGAMETQARKAIASIVSDYILEDLWAAKRGVYFPPFANLAFYKASKELGGEQARGLAPFLIRFDPFNAGSNERPGHQESYIPSVDTEFRPIDPETIYARKFVAASESAISPGEIMEKTERAEKYHQDMLRDIAIRLRSIGLMPQQSSSIDLFVEIGGFCIISEIKTSSIVNIFNQSAKGCFQLGAYNYAVQNIGFKIQGTCLILQNIPDDLLKQHYSLIISSLGIRAFFYDSQISWPQRLPGFVEFVRSSLLERMDVVDKIEAIDE